MLQEARFGSLLLVANFCIWILPLISVALFDCFVNTLRKIRERDPSYSKDKYKSFSASDIEAAVKLQPTNSNINSSYDSEELLIDSSAKSIKRYEEEEELLIPEYQLDVILEDVATRGIGGKLLLSGAYGRFAPGKLIAIMGPSGAGKSTLLKVLTGKLRPTAGQVYINNRPDSLAGYKTILGFVPQEDIMLAELTVKENIAYSAELRLPRNWSSRKKKLLVRKIISMLGLTHIRHSLIGSAGTHASISGGERKRVSIGMELAALPSILFLDEPTSGLDSTTALALVKNLKEIARKGFFCNFCDTSAFTPSFCEL